MVTIINSMVSPRQCLAELWWCEADRDGIWWAGGKEMEMTLRPRDTRKVSFYSLSHFVHLHGWRYGLECGVRSLEEGVGRRSGLEGGVKSPGLEEGVLSAVFDMVAESIVQIQQRRRHYG